VSNCRQIFQPKQYQSYSSNIPLRSLVASNPQDSFLHCQKETNPLSPSSNPSLMQRTMRNSAPPSPKTAWLLNFNWSCFCCFQRRRLWSDRGSLEWRWSPDWRFLSSWTSDI